MEWLIKKNEELLKMFYLGYNKMNADEREMDIIL
jgi:hypothetical protein